MKLCDYGCGQPAKHQFKNGKWCCSKHFRSCSSQRKKTKRIRKDPNSKFNSDSYKAKLSDSMKEAHKDPNSKYNSFEYKKKKSIRMKELHKDPNSKYNSIEHKENLSDKIKKAYKDPNNKLNSFKLTIETLNIKYPFFSKIEELRHNPNKPEEKEVQVHCKNHNCKNSKEKGGWFTPGYWQLSDRIKALESKEGSDCAYLYCSQHCKDTCPLYRIQSDPYRNTNKPYTAAEYNTCRSLVFERENGLCEYCGEPATDMHHIFPVKKEPFFALDPDYCVACCEKHHYEHAHKDECSTGNLAKIVCSVESQKFLNQK
jgi:hypothetical protein